MDINATLEQSPNKIAEFAQIAEESRFLFKEAEIRLKQDEAKLHLTTKMIKTGMTAGDIKATVEADVKIYEQRLAVISHESEYKKASIELEKWINAFNAARKLANVKIEEMRSLHNSR